MDIDHLLAVICSRHAQKHISSYVRDLEQSLGIKLKLGCQKYEYVFDADLGYCIDAKELQNRILEFKKQQPAMFTVEKCIRCFSELHAEFKFHPENAL